MLFGTAQRLKKLLRQISIKCHFGDLCVTTSYKYLGISLDSSLNLNTHFASSYKKATSRLHYLGKLRQNMDTETAAAIYNSMIIPMFTYCNLVQLKNTETQMKRYASFERRARDIVRPKENTKLRTILGSRKRAACEFVIGCIERNTCEDFYGYFSTIDHNFNQREQHRCVG